MDPAAVPLRVVTAKLAILDRRAGTVSVNGAAVCQAMVTGKGTGLNRRAAVVQTTDRAAVIEFVPVSDGESDKASYACLPAVKDERPVCSDSVPPQSMMVVAAPFSLRTVIALP